MTWQLLASKRERSDSWYDYQHDLDDAARKRSHDEHECTPSKCDYCESEAQEKEKTDE